MCAAFNCTPRPLFVDRKHRSMRMKIGSGSSAALTPQTHRSVPGPRRAAARQSMHATPSSCKVEASQSWHKKIYADEHIPFIHINGSKAGGECLLLIALSSKALEQATTEPHKICLLTLIFQVPHFMVTPGCLLLYDLAPLSRSV